MCYATSHISTIGFRLKLPDRMRRQELEYFTCENYFGGEHIWTWTVLYYVRRQDNIGLRKHTILTQRSWSIVHGIGHRIPGKDHN